MNKKILIAGFFTAMMLAVTFSSSAEQTVIGDRGRIDLQGTSSEMEINSQYISGESAELPMWSVGDFWEYDMSIALTAPSCNVFTIIVKRMDIVAIDDENEYTLGLSGYLDKFVFNSLEYSPDASYVSGNAHVDKSTLSMKSFELCLLGNSPNIGFDVELSMGFDPELDFLDFPISLGEPQWNIATDIDITINGNIKFHGINIPVEEEFLDMPISDSLEALSTELINVEAGEFESFKISGELGDTSNLWYSSEAGYLTRVQIAKDFPLGYEFGCTLELLSTNYNHPENNGAPDIPSINGLDKGKKGEEYEYIVSTTDPDGEDVYYKIDWGDGTCSDWLGPNASGEEVTVKHTWTSDATFNIRAKAKDINGYQTRWSDPFTFVAPVEIPGSSQSQQSSQQQSQSIPSGIPSPTTNN